MRLRRQRTCAGSATDSVSGQEADVGPAAFGGVMAAAERVCQCCIASADEPVEGYTCLCVADPFGNCIELMPPLESMCRRTLIAAVAIGAR